MHNKCMSPNRGIHSVSLMLKTARQIEDGQTADVTGGPTEW